MIRTLHSRERWLQVASVCVGLLALIQTGRVVNIAWVLLRYDPPAFFQLVLSAWLRRPLLLFNPDVRSNLGWLYWLLMVVHIGAVVLAITLARAQRRSTIFWAALAVVAPYLSPLLLTIPRHRRGSVIVSGTTGLGSESTSSKASSSASSAVPSSAAISSSLFGGRGRLETPRLLILLVDRTPPGGPETHIRRLLNSLPPQEIPSDVILKVTDSYADQGYIAANTMFTPLQQGIRVDADKTWYRSYSTADGVNGTQVFVYE